MKRLCTLIASAALALAQPAFATDAPPDDASFGSMLALVHAFVRIAADAPDEAAMRRGVDGLLAGENADVNRAAGRIVEEVGADMTHAERAQFAAIARDLLRIARRAHAREALADPGAARALAARRELNAIGLRYHDAGDFLAAVRRGDALAVELFVAARGVDPAVRGADGRSALEIAQGADNPALVSILRRAARP